MSAGTQSMVLRGTSTGPSPLWVHSQPHHDTIITNNFNIFSQGFVLG